MLVQTVSLKNWKRSFTFSLSGVEPTVASLSLDKHHSANHWATYGPFSHVGCQDKTGHGRSRQVQVSQKLRLSTGGNPWKIITQVLWRHLLSTAGVPFMHFPDTFRAPFEYPNRPSTTSLDLHMLIVPFRYLFGTLLIPKVATGSHAPDVMRTKAQPPRTFQPIRRSTQSVSFLYRSVMYI